MNALIKVVAVISLAGALGACSGMTRQDQNTALGAAIGGVGGAALTSGSALGTIGGAAVGGIIGHEVGKDKR